MNRIKATYTNHLRYTFSEVALPIIPQDVDAAAFIELYEIIDNVEISALDTLCSRLKNGALHGTDNWLTAFGIYPITIKDFAASLGNIKNLSLPLVSKGFDPTHSANGLDFVGSKYLATGISFLDLGLYSFTISQYQGADLMNTTFAIFGAFNGVTYVQTYPKNNFGNAVCYVYINNGSYDYVQPTSSSAGLQTFIARNKATNEGEWFVGDTSLGIETLGSAAFSPPEIEIYYNARNNQGSPDSFNPNESRFGYIGLEMNVEQLEDYNHAVNEYQTSLGRNV